MRLSNTRTGVMGTKPDGVPFTAGLPAGSVVVPVSATGARHAATSDVSTARLEEVGERRGTAAGHVDAVALEPRGLGGRRLRWVYAFQSSTTRFGWRHLPRRGLALCGE